MRLGFVVNDVGTEESKFTTMRLGQAAVNRGHEVWIIGVGDFAYDPDGMIRARATSVPRTRYGTSDSFTSDLKGKNAVKRRITVDELDALMLRNVPSDDYLATPLGGDRGKRVRADRNASRRDCAERPHRAFQGVQQDVLPAFPRTGPAADADHARS